MTVLPIIEVPKTPKPLFVEYLNNIIQWPLRGGLFQFKIIKVATTVDTVIA